VAYGVPHIAGKGGVGEWTGHGGSVAAGKEDSGCAVEPRSRD
jgi:hypothetical protein